MALEGNGGGAGNWWLCRILSEAVRIKEHPGASVTAASLRRRSYAWRLPKQWLPRGYNWKPLDGVY